MIASKFVDVEGLRLHYTEMGSGAPVLCLHGWPTSAYLYRNVQPAVAAHRRVIALDLPGFGRSEKPTDASYSFRFYTRIIDGFLAALGIEQTGLVVHDLGGPVGLYWMTRDPTRVRELVLLNTLVYPKFSWAVAAFVASTKLPGLRGLLASPRGLRWTMGLGMATPPTADVIDAVQAPFKDKAARKVLLKTGGALHPKGFVEIAKKLPEFTGPVRAIYGTQDRILPDVAKTMARVATDLPQTEVTALDGCGHFLQEDRPEALGTLLAAFFEHTTP